MILHRLQALYLRYAAFHADRLGGVSLPRRGRRRTGQVETIIRSRGLTRVTGWADAEEIRIDWPDGHAKTRPNISRPDVVRRFPIDMECGFELDLPESARPLTMTVMGADGWSVKLPVPHPADPPTAAAHRRLKRAFLRDLFRALPAGIRWLRKKDPADRRMVKRMLGLDDRHLGLAIDPRYFSEVHSAPALRGFTIILPVHNAFDVVVECLERVERHTDLDWHMVLIDDASTDARVRPYLESWSAAQGERVTFIGLDENHGFVGAVNRGFAVAEALPGHVVLLNSDAMVPANWASRLLAPLEADPMIASVTPMSNDAEIFSVPVMGERLQIGDGAVDRINAIAQTLSLPSRLPSAPTGVGFCMAMHAQWVATAPRFDTAFGRGYGEEVDWCQKVRLRGGRHIGLPTVFVEHRGGQSFGAEAKRDLVFKANGMIARRYPSYDLDVQGFIGRDPLRTPRLALAIAMACAASPDALPIFVAHSMGGGADQALMDEVNARLADHQFALILRVGGTERWQMEVHGPTGPLAGTIGDLSYIQKLLAPVEALRIVYSCGVGDADPVGLPGALRSLRRADKPDILEARVHDFFMVSPSYCLLGADGRYRGPVLSDNADLAHIAQGPTGHAVPLERWQAEWHAFLAECAEITVFSDSSREVLLGSYPDLAHQIVTRPHQLSEPIEVVAKPKPSQRRTIAVLGNVNRQKGAQILCDMAQRAQSMRDAPGMVLIGNIDTSFTLPSSIRLHGSYQRSEISRLAHHYGVTDWLIPSIWPETFSYVTHEALATGLPVYGFDIGAQGEALVRSINGHPIPFDPDDDHATLVLDVILRGAGELGDMPTQKASSKAAE